MNLIYEKIKQKERATSAFDSVALDCGLPHHFWRVGLFLARLWRTAVLSGGLEQQNRSVLRNSCLVVSAKVKNGRCTGCGQAFHLEPLVLSQTACDVSLVGSACVIGIPQVNITSFNYEYLAHRFVSFWLGMCYRVAVTGLVYDKDSIYNYICQIGFEPKNLYDLVAERCVPRREALTFPDWCPHQESDLGQLLKSPPAGGSAIKPCLPAGMGDKI